MSAHLGILDVNKISEASEVTTQQDPLGMEIHQMFDELSTPTFIVTEVNVSNLIREVVTEYGVDFDADHATIIIDHTGYAVSEIGGQGWTEGGWRGQMAYFNCV
ncbi:hypothetical protein GQ457_02G037190 [Hibiscus cannabinus]